MATGAVDRFAETASRARSSTIELADESSGRAPRARSTRITEPRWPPAPRAVAELTTSLEDRRRARREIAVAAVDCRGIDCVATESVAIVKLAVPPPSKAAVPSSTVVPSWKVTVPVGVPLPGATAAIVAVKVTAWPAIEGLADKTTDVRLGARLVDPLVDGRRGAGREVAVAAVDRRDRVVTHREPRRRECGEISR